MTPYLIISLFYAQNFLRLLCGEEDKCGIHEIKVSRNALAISHIMYADDLLIMCRANKEEAMAVNNCFEKYCEWSSQEINGRKSSILFSRFTDKRDIHAIKKIFGFKEMASDSIYLGNHLFSSRNKTK